MLTDRRGERQDEHGFLIAPRTLGAPSSRFLTILGKENKPLTCLSHGCVCGGVPYYMQPSGTLTELRYNSQSTKESSLFQPQCNMCCISKKQILFPNTVKSFQVLICCLVIICSYTEWVMKLLQFYAIQNSQKSVMWTSPQVFHQSQD